MIFKNLFSKNCWELFQHMLPPSSTYLLYHQHFSPGASYHFTRSSALSYFPFTLTKYAIKTSLKPLKNMISAFLKLASFVFQMYLW